MTLLPYLSLISRTCAGPRTCALATSGGGARDLGENDVLGAKRLLAAFHKKQNGVDRSQGAGPMRHNDDDAAARTHASDGARQRLVASESRFEFGSSSTTRKGSPYSPRARPMRWRWPAERPAPSSPMWVS